MRIHYPLFLNLLPAFSNKEEFNARAIPKNFANPIEKVMDSTI